MVTPAQVETATEAPAEPQGASIGDNIRALARLAAEVKRETRLNESSIMHIFDLTFTLAERDRQNQRPPQYPDGVLEEDELIELPDSIPQIPLAEEGDENVLAAATPAEPEES